MTEPMLGTRLVRLELEVMVDLDAYSEYCYEYPTLAGPDEGPAGTLAREAIAAFESNGLLVASDVHDPKWKEAPVNEPGAPR